MKDTGIRTERIKPHWSCNYHIAVKHHEDGSLAYNLERNGTMCHRTFRPCTKEQLDKVIRNAAKLAEAQVNGLGLIETLKEVYG